MQFYLHPSINLGIIKGIDVFREGGIVMQRQRQQKRRRFSWFFLIMVGSVIYFSSIIISQQLYLSQVGQDQAAAEARLAAAQKENEALRQEKEKLNELGYIEKIAREELGMTRAGELPYTTGRSK